MIRTFVLNKYLSIEFSKIVIVTILTFFCLGFIMNLFEEINFFKDIDIGIYLPVLLTSMKVPTLLHNMLPFIVLISGILFFLKIKKSDEITAIKVSGMSNLSVILIPSIISIILGIIFISLINPITAVSLKKYEMIKGKYERDKDYLAAITKNGIWIKEKDINKNNIIRATSLKDNNLLSLSIYEFDKDNNFIKRVESDYAEISTQNWKLKNVNIFDENGRFLSQNLPEITYNSIYDLKKIKSLYSNIDTVSFWEIGSEIKLLEERGYSTKQMETKFHRSLAFPFFLLSMVFLSGVFTLGMNLRENNIVYIFITIITCILVYFFNDFSAALGETEKLSVETAVWMPIIIIFVFGTAGMIYANQK